MVPEWLLQKHPEYFLYISSIKTVTVEDFTNLNLSSLFACDGPGMIFHFSGTMLNFGRVVSIVVNYGDRKSPIPGVAPQFLELLPIPGFACKWGLPITYLRPEMILQVYQTL